MILIASSREIPVDNCLCLLPCGCEYTKYDEWGYYSTKRGMLAGNISIADFMSIGHAECSEPQKCMYAKSVIKDNCSMKAIDLITYNTRNSTKVIGLVEFKDYSIFNRSKKMRIYDEVAIKIRDTYAGVLAAAFKADGEEKKFSGKVIKANRAVALLCIKLSDNMKKMYPNYHNDMQRKLKNKIGHMVSSVKVLDVNNEGVFDCSNHLA